MVRKRGVKVSTMVTRAKEEMLEAICKVLETHRSDFIREAINEKIERFIADSRKNIVITYRGDDNE